MSGKNGEKVNITIFRLPKKLFSKFRRFNAHNLKIAYSKKVKMTLFEEKSEEVTKLRGGSVFMGTS